MKKITGKITCALILVSLMPTLLTSCMTDKEYQLRKEQIEVQKEWQKQSIYDALAIDGPVTIDVKEKGKVIVRAPNQPFKEITIPDGIKSQTDLVKHLISIGAISVVGWRAIDKANGGDHVTNNNYTSAE